MAPEGTHSLTVKSERIDDKSIVHCTGDLVTTGCAYLQKTVAELLPGSKLIQLDLTHLNWIDSMGLGTLVRLYASAKSGGSCLELINLGKQIRELLGITHLLSLFGDMCEKGVAPKF